MDHESSLIAREGPPVRCAARLVFGAVAALLWLTWAYVMFSGDPLQLHGLYAQLPPVPDRHPMPPSSAPARWRARRRWR